MESEGKTLHMDVRISSFDYDLLKGLGFAFERNVEEYLHDMADLIQRMKEQGKKNED